MPTGSMPKLLRKKYINTGFIIALIILLSVNVVIYLNIRFHIEDEKIITETLQTIQTAEALYSKTVEASSNRRGYLITNNLEFMQAYYPAINSMDSLYTNLKYMTQDNEKEKFMLDTLGQLIYNRKDIWEESLEIQEKHLKDIKAQIEYTKKGKEVHDKIKSIILRLQSEENDVLVTRLKEADQSANYTLTNLVTGNIIAFILLITGIILLNRNITQREHVEKTLEESRKWLATTLESIGDAVIVSSKIGEILFINKAAEQITGWKQEEAKGMLIDHVFNILNEDTRQKVESPVHKVISSRKIVGLANHTVLITKNGSEIPIDDSAAPIINMGMLDGVVLVFRDVSERRKAEKELLSSRKFIERIADSIPSIIYIYSLSGPKINYANYKIADFLGYTPDDVIKMKENFFLQFIHPDDILQLKKLYEKYSNTRDNEILDYEYRIKNSKGEWRWFRSYDVVFTRGNDGLVTEMLGSALDVTDRKKMEEELKKYSGHLEELVQMRTHELSSANTKLKEEITERARAERNIIDAEEKFRSLVENSLVGIYIIQEDIYAYTNPKHDEIFGYSRNEMLGMSLWKVIPEESKQPMREASQKRMSRNFDSLQYSYKALKKDGTIIDVEVRETKMQYNGSIAVIGTLQDITERKKAEEELIRQREHLEKSLHEKELLLKEIHHRVKNNLQIIVSLLKLQSKYISDPKDLRIFNSSRSRVETMSLIHEKLYKSKDISDIDLGNYVKDLVTHILKAYKVDHEDISFNLKSDIIKLTIDTAIPCGLIINELINNTLKYAFPEGHHGKIDINITKADDEITLEIKDNGSGIPASFDIANSDSLGLQLVETLIKQISGTVDIDRTEGTKFIIKFKEIKYKERI